MTYIICWEVIVLVDGLYIKNSPVLLVIRIASEGAGGVLAFESRRWNEK